RKLDVGFEDRGEQQLKNIAKPVRTYALQRKRPEAAVESVQATATQRSPTRIVLADDDRNILTSVASDFERQGYLVRSYTDGASALAGLKQTSADLGIFDIKMPRMDGWELFRRVRQFSEMPIIFLTSKDEEIDELVGLRMGADDYIRKPASHRLL